MKKVLAFVIPILLAIGVFATFEYFVNNINGKGALQVTANPQSTVYVDGRLMGKTPLCKCDGSDMLPAGTHSIKIFPSDTQFSPYEEQVMLTKGVLTVVDRTFGSGAYSEGSDIGLIPLASGKEIELLVQSTPDKVNVILDGNAVGQTPLKLQNVTESDHELKLSKDGYREKILRIHTVSGYQLVAKVYLAVNPNAPSPTPTGNPNITPTPTPGPKVIILQTPTGFLRVRASASITAAEVGRVLPREIYDLVDETDGWYEIKLKDGTTGWISSSYAQKQ